MFDEIRRNSLELKRLIELKSKENENYNDLSIDQKIISLENEITKIKNLKDLEVKQIKERIDLKRKELVELKSKLRSVLFDSYHIRQRERELKSLVEIFKKLSENS